MKATIQRDALLSALEAALPVCGKKHTNPILGRVRLKFGTDLWFMATDTVTTVTGTRPVEKAEAADFCVSADQLTEAVRRMSGELKLKLTKEGVFEVKSGERSFKAATIPSDTFPPASERPKEAFTRIPGAALASVVNRVRFAMSVEKRAHDGIHLVMGGGKIEAQAFDGRKIALATADAECGNMDLILPPELVGALVATTEKSTGDISILNTREGLWLDTGGDLYRYIAAAAATFPQKVRTGIEGQTGAAFEGPTKPLLEVIKYTEMAASREAPTVHILVGGGKFRVRAIDGQRECEDATAIDDGGAEFAIKINPRFFAEALTAAGETCRVIRGEQLLRVSAPGFEAGVARLYDESDQAAAE